MTLYCDDYGYRKDADRKILSLIQRGRVSGVSVLSSMASPESLRALSRVLASSPFCQVGLHVNFVEGTSVSKRLEIPTLVTRKRKFYPLWLFVLRIFFGFVSLMQLEREMRNQMDLLLRYNIPVHALDSHQHVHAISPIAEVMIKVADAYGIRRIRSYAQVRAFTPIAQVKYAFLSCVAFLSYRLHTRKNGMPETWKTVKSPFVAFMSWEGKNFEVHNRGRSDLVSVIHPFLPFDTNRSYIRHLT